MTRPLLALAAAACLAAAAAAFAPATARAAEPGPDALYGTYEVREGQTLHDIAIEQNLGFLELKTANPDVDHWLPKPGSTLILPTVHMVPKEFKGGILVNVAAMRLFRFDGEGRVTMTYPIGVGRDGRETPRGATSVVRKKEGPTWYPTENTRKEKPYLPKVVPPGPANPLGTHALYLGWPTYLLHGTDNDYGIGRRVSAGCLRMYNQDVKALFADVPVGTKVEVIDQRIMAQVYKGRLYVEAHPTAAGWDALELGETRPESVMTTDHVAVVSAAAPPGMFIDWDAVAKVIAEERGYPVAVSPAPRAQADAGPRGLIPASLAR